MAKTLTITQVTQAVAGRSVPFIVTAANTDAAAVTLTALQVAEITKAGAFVSQPQFLTSNGIPGSSFPTLLATTGSLSFPFQIAFAAPSIPGASATSNIGGLAGGAPNTIAFPASAVRVFLATAQTSDGTVFSQQFTVSVLSGLAPFPLSDVGTAVFTQGGNSNLVAVLAG